MSELSRSFSQVGLTRRLLRILSPLDQRAVIVPLDDSLIVGPIPGLENLRETATDVVLGGADAVIGFPGLFASCPRLAGVGTIVNLTASVAGSAHTRKMPVATVEAALTLGADAIAAHVNISSKFEPEMLATLGQLSGEAQSVGLPVLAIMYPRRESDNGDDDYLELFTADRKAYTNLVAHAARVGCELGASIIKTQFTGDAETFARVVQACGPVPVVTAGGPSLPVEQMLERAHAAVEAGAAGVSFGRNVYSRDKPRGYVRALRGIVHEGLHWREALDRFRQEASVSVNLEE